MRISFLFSKLLDENQGQWYHHQRKFFSGGGKMHHNSAMLTQQMQTPQKLANRYGLTFSFFPNSGCQSIPYLIYTAVPFPDNDGAKMHPGEKPYRESLLFTVANKTP